jgi:hypothetical protein
MAVPRGLSPQDLDQLRDTLDAGRRPKVVFTAAAGQIAGTIGQVVAFTDPAASDEWIVVKFGRDELPFSPGDLAIPTKAPAQRKATAAATVKTAPVRVSETPAKAAPRPKPEPTPTPRPSPKPEPTPEAKPEEPVRMPETKAEPAPRKVAKPKPPASLTVTLTYADREWMVAATQGSKTLAKPYVIRPTDALRMVALLDVAGVHDAAENIIAAERAEAEGRAQRLRDELAEIEARLSELSPH